MARVLTAFIERRAWRRRLADRVATTMLGAATFIVLLPLFCILGYIIVKGFSAIHWSFFTELPAPAGEVGGGMANALVGTLVLIAIASTVGVPWGIAVGLKLSEFGKGPLARAARFSADLLGSVPSIVIGLFIYAVVVVSMGHFSALAGGLALGVIMIPTIARTTEELLKLVPAHIREAGLSLGLPRWRVTLFIVLRGSLKGLATGVILAVARVAGETAPLLFTAFNNRFWTTAFDEPIASLPVQIYTYAISPFDDWHAKAWTGALVLVMVALAVSVTTRLLVRGPRSVSA